MLVDSLKELSFVGEMSIGHGKDSDTLLLKLNHVFSVHRGTGTTGHDVVVHSAPLDLGLSHSLVRHVTCE